MKKEKTTMPQMVAVTKLKDEGFRHREDDESGAVLMTYGSGSNTEIVSVNKDGTCDDGISVEELIKTIEL